MSPRGVILPVRCMARPRLSPAEREAVRWLAKRGRSARCEASRIARGVVGAFLADQARTDQLERALFDAAQLLTPDPLHCLALDPESGVVERFGRERAVRFEARGWQQLNATEWASETADIAKIVEAQLARRYRGFLK